MSFLTSAVLVGKVRHRSGSATSRRRAPARGEIGEGMGLLWRDRRLRAIAGAAANLNFFGLMVFALLIVVPDPGPRLHPLMIAVVTVAGGAGSLVGAVLAPRVAERIGRGRTIVLGSAVLLARDDRVPGGPGPRWQVLAILVVNELVVGVAIMLVRRHPRRFPAHRGAATMLGRVNTSLSTVTQGVKALGPSPAARSARRTASGRRCGSPPSAPPPRCCGPGSRPAVDRMTGPAAPRR